LYYISLIPGASETVPKIVDVAVRKLVVVPDEAKGFIPDDNATHFQQLLHGFLRYSPPASLWLKGSSIYLYDIKGTGAHRA
jgi:hypothetical protein